VPETWTPITWRNDQSPAINEVNLNRIEVGVELLDDRIATLENGVVTPVVVPYATSVTLNATQGSVFRCVASGDLTLDDIVGGTDGQAIVFEVLASGADRQLSFTGSIGSVTIPANQWWVSTFRYAANTAEWRLIDATGGGSGGSSGGSGGGSSGTATTYLDVDPTGAQDAIPVISAAMTALGSGGGILSLPPGTIRFASRLSITAVNIALIGAGREQTTIVPDAAIGANEVLRFTSTATGGSVRDLAIAATTSANYSALRLAAPNVRVDRVSVTGGTSGALRGITADATATGAEITSCRVSGIRTAANTFGTGVGISAAGDDTVIGQCVVTDCTGVTSAAYYAQMGGIFLAGVAGSSGRRMRVLNCRSHGNGTHGLYASGNDDLTIDGGAYYANGALATASGGVGGPAFGRGITIGGTASSGLKILNTHLFSNEENGLIITGAAGGTGSSDGSLVRDTLVSGNHAYNNNLSAFAGGHGIEVNSFGGIISNNTCWSNHNGISVTGVRQVITGNRCFNNTSSDSTQGCGIVVYFQGVTPPVVNATTTTGSTQVTVTSGGFPNVVVDQVISGTGIAGGSVVIAISGNTLTMNNAAVGDGTADLTFTAVNSNNQIVGNFCSHNDNAGIRVFGTVNHQGVVVSNNSLLYNGLAERAGVLHDLLVSNQSRFGAYHGNSSRSSTSRISISDPFPNRVGNTTASDNGMVRTLTYGASVTWAGENAELATLVVTDGNPFTIGSPSTFYAGRKATYRILNSSGGTMGTITWGTGQFALAGSFTNPANGNSRLITFQFDGSRWLEVSRSVADLPA
jgi:hypothetical protein